VEWRHGLSALTGACDIKVLGTGPPVPSDGLVSGNAEMEIDDAAKTTQQPAERLGQASAYSRIASLSVGCGRFLSTYNGEQSSRNKPRPKGGKLMGNTSLV